MPLCQTDLPAICGAIRVLYRVVQSPPDVNWNPNQDWWRWWENRFGGGPLYPQGDIPDHRELIQAARAWVLNAIMPSGLNMSPEEFPDVVGGDLTNEEKATLLSLGKALGDCLNESGHGFQFSMVHSPEHGIPFTQYLEEILRKLGGGLAPQRQRIRCVGMDRSVHLDGKRIAQELDEDVFAYLAVGVTGLQGGKPRVQTSAEGGEVASSRCS